MKSVPEQERDDAYHVAILATDGVEEVELTEPAGATTLTKRPNSIIT